MDRSEVADVLDRAADALMIYGHRRSELVGADDSMCALGGIGHALGLNVEANDVEEINGEVMGCYVNPAAEAFGRYLIAHGATPAPGDPFGMADAVWRWNDGWHNGPSGAPDDGEVIDHLRRCAKELREQ